MVSKLLHQDASWSGSQWNCCLIRLFHIVLSHYFVAGICVSPSFGTSGSQVCHTSSTSDQVATPDQEHSEWRCSRCTGGQSYPYQMAPRSSRPRSCRQGQIGTCRYCKDNHRDLQTTYHEDGASSALARVNIINEHCVIVSLSRSLKEHMVLAGSMLCHAFRIISIFLIARKIRVG